MQCNSTNQGLHKGYQVQKHFNKGRYPHGRLWLDLSCELHTVVLMLHRHLVFTKLCNTFIDFYFYFYKHHTTQDFIQAQIYSLTQLVYRRQTYSSTQSIRVVGRTNSILFGEIICLFLNCSRNYNCNRRVVSVREDLASILIIYFNLII